jgi:hypothetical protein
VAARGIAYRYLLREEVTNPLLTGKAILAFQVEGVPYYFDGRLLRVSDPSGSRVQRHTLTVRQHGSSSGRIC